MKTYSARVMIRGQISTVTVTARTIEEARRVIRAQYDGRLASQPVEC